MPAKLAPEPVPLKAHWSYVLEEVQWMSNVIHTEAKNKKTNARKCARMVQKYFQDKAMAEKRAEKADELNKRKVCFKKYFKKLTSFLIKFKSFRSPLQSPEKFEHFGQMLKSCLSLC